MRTQDVVNTTIRELNAKTKEIKQAENDDLAELSQAFDEIATIADRTANTLANADQVLAGDGDDEPDDEGDQQDEEQQHEGG